MKKTSKALVLILLFTLISCNFWDKSVPEVTNFVVMNDTEPPVLQGVQSVSSTQVRLIFNEEITPFSDSFSNYTVEVEGYSLLITLNENIKAGTMEMLQGRVKDKYGNTTGIETPVWGFNSNLPNVVINEFSTRGEGNNPDRTELYVQSSGSLAGMVLYNGIPSSWDSMVIFGDLDVKTGDFVVVWWTESLPENVTSKDGIYNVCVKTNVGLAGYNGIITLAESPAQGAGVTDCVVYSNSCATYEGFGSKSVLERVQKAVKNGWWSDISKPINSNNNTATRTMCRRLDGSWYVCETKGATFGSVNNSSEFTI